MTDTRPPASAARDRAFFGHPAGLGWLAGAEFWERFSYYGMQSLLVLYMTHRLLLPGHVGHVAGFAPFEAALVGLYGPMSPQALASNIFGLYAGLVYLTPLLGGWLADRFIGRTPSITIGALLMALGHFLMAFEASFLAALACLLLGVGFFKGNIASQVGALYVPGDARRADAYQIFMLSVQVAVVAAPLVCGALADHVGWDWGFSCAGVGMVVGLGTYLAGRATLPREDRAARGTPTGADADAAPHRPMTRAELRNMVLLVALVPVLALTMVCNQQIFNAYLLWAEKNYALRWMGHAIPVEATLSLDALFGGLGIVASLAFWRWWGRHWREPDELTKVALAALLGAGAPLILALASSVVAATGHPVGLGWAVLFETVNDLAFANVFPIGLALYSRAAPPGRSGLLIGLFYLHLTLGNFLVGRLGGLLETMSGSAFWMLHAALVAGAAVVLMLVRLTVGRSLVADDPDAAGATAAGTPAAA